MDGNKGSGGVRPGALRLCSIPLVFLAVLLSFSARGEPLSPLAKSPDWSRLEACQETITRDEFARLLTTVYAPNGAADKCVWVREDAAIIETGTDPVSWFTLRFTASEEKRKAAPRYWRPAAVLAPPKSKEHPLAGLRIALDPGHLGGKWAGMEGRWFQIGEDKPVAEGDMTLRVAKLLAPELRTLGATVFFTHDTPGPTTTVRPHDLRKAALAELKREGIRFVREKYDGPSDPLMQNSIQWESELLFYRNAEIRHRAQLVNGTFKPDITLCLHFNAEAWGNPAKPELTDKNHMHLIVNGCYTAGELELDDVRFEMLRNLLSQSNREALAVSDKVASALAEATGLPAYEYTGANAVREGSNPYIWARNLLANRLFRCPVIYTEPYVMNSKAVIDQVQMGDYQGERDVNGTMRKSIYREYADAVAKGLAEYYAEARGSGGAR